MLHEPFYLTQEQIDSLTDAEIYNKHFRRFDKEADAYEEIERLNAIEETEERETLEVKHDKYVALCRSFGFSDEQAENEWKAWLKAQE